MGSHRCRLGRVLLAAIFGTAAAAVGAQDLIAATVHGEIVCMVPGPRVFHDGFEIVSVSCGDGLAQGGESCDDGNILNETTCAYGVGNCECCSATCSGPLLLNGPYCGDSTVDASFGEDCDDGNDSACGTCSADCQVLQQAFASGHIVASASAQLVDGETFTLDDGFQSQVFEFDFDLVSPPGRVAVPLTGGLTAGQVATKVAMAINGTPLLVQANSGGSALVQLVHERATSLGNQPIIETVADPGFSVSGLSDGQGGDCPSDVGCVTGADCASGLCSLGVCASP